MSLSYRGIGWAGLILLCGLAVFRCEPADPAGPLLSDLPDGLWRSRYPDLYRNLPEGKHPHDRR